MIKKPENRMSSWLVIIFKILKKNKHAIKKNVPFNICIERISGRDDTLWNKDVIYEKKGQLYKFKAFLVSSIEKKYDCSMYSKLSEDIWNFESKIIHTVANIRINK